MFTELIEEMVHEQNRGSGHYPGRSYKLGINIYQLHNRMITRAP